MVDVHESFAVQMKSNVLMFNYRGCGGSGGFPCTIDDMVSDGDAAMQYVVRTLGVPSHKVLIFGASLGGAVGTMVRGLPQYREG